MRNHYSFSEFIHNIYDLILTKLTFRQARFIRRPVYIRGKQSLSGCRGLTTGRFCRFDLNGITQSLQIGDSCEMGDMTHIVALKKITIGNNVLIASKCFISDTDHGRYSDEPYDNPETPPNERALTSKPVQIGNNVWIGENVVILSGSQIGDGCIIGANSVVTGKQQFPGSCIIAGAPAKIIKRWNAVKKTWDKEKGNE